MAYTIGLTRNNKGKSIFLPTDQNLVFRLNWPSYSLLNGVDYATLGDKEEYKLKNTVDRLNVPDANGNIVLNYIDTNGNKVTTLIWCCMSAKSIKSVLNG
jgi:outer membrane protein insertion porin family